VATWQGKSEEMAVGLCDLQAVSAACTYGRSVTTLKISVEILELLLAPGDNSGGFLGHVVFDPCPRRQGTDRSPYPQTYRRFKPQG
jgi:hypothetical protein